jgi:hypothetical protein
MRARAAGMSSSSIAAVRRSGTPQARAAFALIIFALPTAGTVLTPSGTAAQQPRVHVLEGGPTTVARGYYWSEAPLVLRIESGDIVEMSTFLTSSPTRLESAGIPPDKVEPALRAVYDQVTERGPGGHILTGPVYVEGADPGDVLEVRILSVEMPLAYGYNSCSGFIRDSV